MERGVAHRDGDVRASGADVVWKPYADADAAWEPLGTTPVTAPRLPAVPLRLRVVKRGYASIEVAASGTHTRFVLAAEGDLPPDMVRGRLETSAHNIGGIGEIAAAVGSFDIDRVEVTNRQFKEFGGQGLDYTTTARSGPSPSKRVARR